MTPEVINITWNYFESCAINSFNDLLCEKDFVNVTLVSEDDQGIKAYNLVLAVQF